MVVAPDSFTGSLTAEQAATAAAAGLRAAATAAGSDLDLRHRPVADGGEGSVALLLTIGWRPVTRTVAGPTGAPVTATFALSPAGPGPTSAVVELAAASGRSLLPGGRPEPLRATTYGTGELVSAALDAGARRIVLAIGGSASTDGGTGLAAALGARFWAADGAGLAPGGGSLVDLDRVDLSGLDPRLAEVEVVLACDVDSPLTGPRGAAHRYGPQKGAGPEEVARLDRGLARLADVVTRDLGADVGADRPGAGAAGGTGFGVAALLGARLVPGADLLLDLVGFDAALAGADLVVTGEGSLDGQTLAGKAPLCVARRAAAAGVAVLLIAGRTDLDTAARAELADLGVLDVRALLDLQPDVALAHRDAAALLSEVARRAFADLVPRLHLTRSPA